MKNLLSRRIAIGRDQVPLSQVIAFALWVAIPVAGIFSAWAAIAVGVVGLGFYLHGLSKPE